MKESLIYITCASKEEAESIGTALVEKRLVACVNLINGIESLYWWEGKVERGQEVILLAKTRSNRVIEVTQSVKEMHSYDVPCIVALDIEGGNPDFLNWIREETR